MINKLSKLKYWELAALCLTCSVTAILLLAFAVRFLVGTWPQAGEAAHIVYTVLSAALAWLICGLFIEAGFQKARTARVAGYLDEMLLQINTYDDEDARERDCG